MLPNSVAGTPLDRIMPARSLPEVLARYRRVCEQPAIGMAAGRVFLSLGGSGVGERLLLPLADATGQVFQMLGATLYQIGERSEEHTSEIQSLMRISYAVFCLKKKQHITEKKNQNRNSIDTK